MKKFLAILLSVVAAFTVFSFSACASKGDVNLKYYKDGSELIPALRQGAVSFGVLAEPAATKLENLTKDEKVWYRLDIQELWDGESKAYPQAVMLVKESLLNTYQELVNSIAAKFDESAAWVYEHKDETVESIYKNTVAEEGITPSFSAAILTKSVVLNCNIKWQNATDAKNAVKDYLKEIIAIESKSAVDATDELFYDGNAAGEFTKDTVQVYAPDGAPALAIAKFVYDNENFGTGKTFEYHVVKADNIGGKVQQGAGDIVILPVNAASKLYKANSADPYKLVSVITHGNLYLMCSEEITANDLKDKTIGVFGLGNVPDLTFKAVLGKLGYTPVVAE